MDARLEGARRHEDAIVLVFAHAALPLAREHTDHGERRVADPYDLTERIGTLAEEVHRDSATDDCIFGRTGHVRSGETDPLFHRPVPDHEILGHRPVDGGGPGARFGDHRRHRAQYRCSGADERQLGLDGPQVVPGKGRLRAHAAAHAARTARTGEHQDDVGAGAFDLRADAALGALADRHHADDRRHADDDAERGEDGSQRVAAQRTQRHTHGFTGGDHGVASALRVSERIAPSRNASWRSA